MRRWNGWGDDSITYPLPAAVARFLAQMVGPGERFDDAALEPVLAALPPAHLPAHRLINCEPLERLLRARGQSLPDWIALRSGRIGRVPDGVACPTSAAEVGDLLRLAADVGARVIPYGGGTSVVGHINPPADVAPTLTIDMRRMNDLRHFDATSRLATFGAGVTGPDLEARLRARGYTLGHFPQSFEYSTLGGWIATRSSGQQSLGYGRIEHLFAGGRLTAPAGELALPSFPASAAGPDLRELLLGSEGRLGVITEATVRIRPLPAHDDVHTVFFPDWERAVTATREIIQAELPLSLLRLSTPVETETTLALAGHEALISGLERLLGLRGVREGKCMLMLGVTGAATLVRFARREALTIAARHGGVHIGRAMGRQWHKSRFRTPYLRNALWELGYALDTVETATAWSNVPALVNAVETALRSGLAAIDERVHAFTHLSHLYPTGSSVYTTYLYRRTADPDETLRRWQTLKAAASQAIVAHGGTISHQHGVGTDHRPYLTAEKTPLGLEAIDVLCRRFDPAGIMNPGKLT